MLPECVTAGDQGQAYLCLEPGSVLNGASDLKSEAGLVLLQHTNLAERGEEMRKCRGQTEQLGTPFNLSVRGTPWRGRSASPPVAVAVAAGAVVVSRVGAGTSQMLAPGEVWGALQAARAGSRGVLPGSDP